MSVKFLEVKDAVRQRQIAREDEETQRKKKRNMLEYLKMERSSSFTQRSDLL